MPRNKAQSIGDLLAQYIRGTEAEKTLQERKIMASWNQLMGPMVARFTGDLDIKNGTLFVHIHSAALRQQLFEQRYAIIKKLNETVGAKVLTDIRILG
jgi:predicted nucleic acid-binding Zn ribbon protein